MNKATPVQIRKALDLVNKLKIAGIIFIPMPVIDDQDLSDLIVQASNRLEQIADMEQKK